MTPDSAATVQQLLAFSLEAGVDCALAEVPVTRLSEPDIDPAPRQAAPAPVRTMAAAIPPSRGEAAPAPEVAILSAREAARTAPTLEALRRLLENFDGCALKSTATRLVFADAAGDANLPAVHPAANRTGEPGRAGDARQSLDADAALDPRGHHENPWQMVRLRHWHAGDPRACHLPSGLSIALALLQAHGVAGFAGDREGAGDATRQTDVTLADLQATLAQADKVIE